MQSNLVSEQPSQSSPSRAAYYRENAEVIKKRSRDYYWANRDKCLKQARKRRSDQPERAKALARKSHIKCRYGLSQEQYDTLFSLQDSKCAICCSAEPKGRGDWHVDHCHRTGKVRGLLCHHCNLLLGHASDCVGTLERAISYLKKSED